jgi:hypothetical protein
MAIFHPFRETLSWWSWTYSSSGIRQLSSVRRVLHKETMLDSCWYLRSDSGEIIISSFLKGSPNNYAGRWADQAPSSLVYRLGGENFTNEAQPSQ